MNNFWNIEELRQMHIELTNACNAACPMCVRFFQNSTLIRPDLEINQITLDKFKKYFPQEIISQCKLILFCGVHGDPIMARDTLEICQYIQDVSGPETVVQLNTNGGVRDSAWWTAMGELFSNRKKWRIVFSIDGLEDTNHLYRRNVNWSKLMQNVKSYLSAEGTAVWEFLIFKHNEHQIQAAESLARELGFYKFIPKKALGVDNGQQLTPLPALSREGELDYIIEAPNDPANRNLKNPTGTLPVKIYKFDKNHYNKIKENGNFRFEKLVSEIYSDIKNKNYEKQDQCQIKCKSNLWSGGKEIFVDNFGRVMPCCYVGTHLNGRYTDDKTLQLHKEMNEYGWDKFSLENYSLKEILEQGHLNNVFADSWSRDKIANGKMLYCSETCGEESHIDRIYTHDSIAKDATVEKFFRK